MSEKYSRIIYSPEVKVYILPGATSKYSNAQPIDISEDIIEGSISRVTEGVSKASFLVQSRKLKDNSNLLGSIIRPMDRIVVYLKKVKPILVFSGYLDLVPLFQAVPEPFTIEASCTLKRLEFTYWDPQLPHVYETLARYGFIPSANGQGGMDFFVPPASTATGAGNKAASGPIQDTGFGAMLYFLLNNVGGWDPDSIWIEPLPVQWMQRAYYLFQVSNDWNERYNTAQSFLKSFLTSGGSGGDSSGDSDGSTATISGDSVAAKIKSYIAKYNGATVTAEDFIKAGEKYNIDPRFLVVLAALETGIGTANPSQASTENDMFGLGGGRHFSSLAEGIMAAAQALREGGPDKYAYPLNDNSNFGIKKGIAGWNRGNPTTAAVYEEDFIKDYKALATSDSPVDITKPYSITGQGIGTSRNNGGATITRDTTDPAPSDAGTTPNNVLSVYLEAGHTGGSSGMQPGYQGQTGEDNEQTHNKAIVEAVKNAYNALPEAKKAKLDINFASDTSRPKGWQGDVYISVHHSKEYADSTHGKIGNPCQWSVRGQDSSIGSKNKSIPNISGDQQGKPGPNYYGYSGWKMPSELGEGRDRIDNDTNLIKNSTTLTSFLCSKLSQQTARSFASVANSSQSNNRVTNYYGFYYSNAAACALIEFPADYTTYSVKRYALGVLDALLDYANNWKAKGKQQPPNGASVSGTQTTQASSGGGDDSPASKVIAAALKAVKYNQEDGNWSLPYHMDSNDRANGKTIEEVIQGKLSTDCSSFINCCMKSAGIAKSSSETTYTLIDNSTEVGDKTNYEPGMLFNSGDHVVIVTSVDGDIAESTSRGAGVSGTRRAGKDNGPQSVRKADYFINTPKYKLYKHNDIGSTLQPPTGSDVSSSSGGGGSGSGSGVDPFLISKSTAFNVAFNFPGSMLDSVLLTGERALENDVKLLDTIQEVCKASQRTFSSLPNGDFIAWYPDYFNLTGENAWLKISPTEIKSCTISLNDKNLVTHLYILGNPFGFNASAGSTINLEWYEKLMGAGVVTLERPWLLDSFLRPFESEDIDQNTNQTNTQNSISGKKPKTVSRPRSILEAKNGRLEFLERYGARPYMDKIPTIRHPIMEFFYAYHTFIQKWAEQFISRAEFTFMPELFPGMIVELEMKHGTGDDFDNKPNSITFYVKDVSHNFSYESGFSTTATLMAPGTTSKHNDWAMVLVNPPNVQGEYKKNKTIKIAGPKKNTKKTNKKGATKPKQGNKKATSRGSQRQNPPRQQPDPTVDPVTLTDGQD
jgi:hypothetical protein